MNRNEKRFLERQNKKENKASLTEREKNIIWFQNWTPSQVKFHKQLVKEIAEDSNKIIEEIMDSCYIAAMVQETDLNLEQCTSICKIADNHMIETKNIIEEDGDEYFNMIKDEKLRSKIKEEIKIIIKGSKKINNLEIIREIDKKYKVPKKDLQIICKEVREKLANEMLKEIENSIEPPKIEIPYSVTQKEIEKGRNVPVKDVVKELGIVGAEFKAPSTLKIINTTIEIQGEYATYKKDSQGVNDGYKTFKDIEDLKDYKEVVESDFDKTMEEIQEQLNIWNKKRLELESNRNKRLNKIMEIEQVFSM